MPKKKKSEQAQPLQEMQEPLVKAVQDSADEAPTEPAAPAPKKAAKRTRKLKEAAPEQDTPMPPLPEMELPGSRSEPLAPSEAQEPTQDEPAKKASTKRARKKPTCANEAPPNITIDDTGNASKGDSTAAPKAEEPKSEETPTAPKSTPTLALPPAPKKNLPTINTSPTALDTTVPPVLFPALEQERKSFWSRMLVLLLLGAVIFASVLVLIHRPGAYSERSNSIRFLYSATTADTRIVVNGAVLEGSFAGECTATSYNASGNTAAALIGGTLYLIDGREVTALAEAVADFLISQNGKAVVYRTADNTLCYVELGRELKASTISTDCRSANFCLSPNGKEFFYTYTRDEEQYVDFYSRTNSKPLLKSYKGLTPVAVGDRCKYLYYLDAAGDLFYMEQDSEIPVKIYAAAVGEFTMTFNRDFSELLLNCPNGTQLWDRGERVVIPGNLATGEILALLPNQRVAGRVLPLCTQYLQNSFRKAYYLKSGTEQDGLLLMYLDRKGELSVVSFVDDAAGAVTVTDKGVYYLVVEKRSDDSVMKHLYHCPLGKSEGTRLVWDVREFLANSDGSRVFYTDQHGALYAMKLEAIPTRLADTVNTGSLRVSGDDAFYYQIGTTLYTSDNGDVPRIVWEGAAPAVLADNHTVYFLVSAEDGTLTVHTNHRNRRHSEQIATGVTSFS